MYSASGEWAGFLDLGTWVTCMVMWDCGEKVGAIGRALSVVYWDEKHILPEIFSSGGQIGSIRALRGCSSPHCRLGIEPGLLLHKLDTMGSVWYGGHVMVMT